MNDRLHPSPKLLASIYDASLDPTLWSSALATFRTELDGALSAMFFRDQALSGTDFSLLGTSGYPESALAAYGAYYVTRDVRSPTIAQLRPQDIYVDDGQISFEAVRRSEIFNDYFRLVDGGYAMGANLFQEAGRFCVVSLHRSIISGAPDPSHVERFRLTTPHFVRALQMHRQIAQAKALSTALTTALDHFAMAVLLVDDRCRVVFLNAAAELLLSRQDCPLKVDSGRLRVRSSKDAALLEKDVKLAVEIGRGLPSKPPAIRRLPRTVDADTQLGLMVAPARQPDLFGLPVYEPLALIFIADPALPPPSGTAALVGQFGLSEAEARVVTRLMQGDSIDVIADQRRVSRETIRVQLRSVLGKTGTRSQGQLIALAARSLAVLCRLTD